MVLAAASNSANAISTNLFLEAVTLQLAPLSIWPSSLVLLPRFGTACHLWPLPKRPAFLHVDNQIWHISHIHIRNSAYLNPLDLHASQGRESLQFHL